MYARFFRWILGSVSFSAEGGFPERFINLMEKNGIPAQYLNPTPVGFTGAVRPGQYHKLRPIARKSGMRIRMKSKSGLPFLLYPYHHRVGLAIGSVFLCCMLLTMQLFVWSIHIEGCNTLDEGTVRQQLQEAGVYPGAFIPKLDAFRCERDMMQEIPELSWIAVNILGSTVEVKLRERVMPPPKVDREDTAANVISSGTGIIREMEVYSGQPLVQVGEAVWEGRMLVTGIFVSNQHTLVRYARAKVIAEVEETFTVKIPLKQEKQRFTDETATRYLLKTKRNRLLLNPWCRIPEQAQMYVQESPTLFGLSFLTETYRGQETYCVSFDRESAKQEALRQLEALEKAQLENGYLTRELHGELMDGSFVLTAKYTCLKNIAATREILMDDF